MKVFIEELLIRMILMLCGGKLVVVVIGVVMLCSSVLVFVLCRIDWVVVGWIVSSVVVMVLSRWERMCIVCCLMLCGLNEG